MYSFIIIGQGLAGSALAHSLRQRGIDNFLVVDPGYQSSSSLAAAGVFNPITGVRWNKSWLANELFSSLHHFYPEVEQFLGTQFFHALPILQFIETIEQQNFLMGKSAHRDYKEFVSIPEKHLFEQDSPLGAVEIQQSGFIQVLPYLQATRKWLLDTSRLVEKRFESEQISINSDGIFWGDRFCEHLVFCTGLGQVNLLKEYPSPLIPLKGEMIEMATDQDFFCTNILKKKVLCVPVSNHSFWVGSTYDRIFDSAEPSEDGKQFLVSGFNEIWPFPAKVVRHWAGLRPTTPDRRPLVGRIPGTKNMHLLNGLGTKGVSLSPFFAGALISQVLGGDALHSEVSPNRFLNRK